MSNIKKLILSGAAGGGAGLNVEEVFSSDLFYNASHNTPETVTNGIDFAGEGGLRIAKRRDASSGWVLTDTTMNSLEVLRTSSANAIDTNEFDAVNTFNSDGFTTGNLSGSNIPWANWSFRKAPKFFDIQTWTGNGVNGRSISHSLAHTVGMIIVKCTSTSSTNWVVWHRGASGTLWLNSSNADSANGGGQATSGIIYNPGSNTTAFTVDDGANVNQSSRTYVAYIFAHHNDDGNFGLTGDQDIIKCGSYTGNASTSSGPTIDLGFEPQFLLTKNVTNGGTNWSIVDNMRAFCHGDFVRLLYPHKGDAETETSTTPSQVAPLQNGYQIQSSGTNFNQNGETYIYVAIRRGPMGAPTSASDVFEVDQRHTGDPNYTTTFAADWAWNKSTSGSNTRMYHRLTHNFKINMDSGSTLQNGSGNEDWDYHNGVELVDSSTYWAWIWKRHPQFFEMDLYKGTGQPNRVISHQLGVTPEMVWIKNWQSSNFFIWHTDLGNDHHILLNSNAKQSSALYMRSASDTGFTLGTQASGVGVNQNGEFHIMYTFATLAGISKVGSYTGNGSSQTIDCGFSNGAKMVLIKQTDTSGTNWFLFDNQRGIVSGNDPVLRINTTDLASSNEDAIDPVSSGFSVTNSSNTNDNGGTYIFYAIAA